MTMIMPMVFYCHPVRITFHCREQAPKYSTQMVAFDYCKLVFRILLYLWQLLPALQLRSVAEPHRAFAYTCLPAAKARYLALSLLHGYTKFAVFRGYHNDTSIDLSNTTKCNCRNVS